MSKNIPTQTAPGKRGEAQDSDRKPNIRMAIATDCWLELLAYPPGSARSLWLKLPIDDKDLWKRLDDPSLHVQEAVLDAFRQSDGRFEVRVWYDDSQEIAGLVVNSK